MIEMTKQALSQPLFINVPNSVEGQSQTLDLNTMPKNNLFTRLSKLRDEDTGK